MISALILTFNEENYIGECVASLKWADEILVVDSQSHDQTRKKAEKAGAKVLAHPFKDFASQRNFAITQASGTWLFFVDADERPSMELVSEIRDFLEGSPAPCVVEIPRHTYFFGKRLRFSGAQDDYPPRLFPRQGVNWKQPVHEKIESRLPRQRMRYPLLHYSTRDRKHYQEKLDRYISFELEVMAQKKVAKRFYDPVLRPFLKFCYLYFWKMGLLDGVAGFQYAYLSAYYDFLRFRRYSSSQGSLATSS